MMEVRSLGMVLNDPQRSQVALHALRDLVTAPADLDALGVATCVDNSVLQSRRPSPDSRALSELVGNLRGRCAVVQLRRADELRPPRTSPNNVGPFRMRNFACAVVGGPQDADRAAVSRDALLADIPDFLRRSVGGQTEGEAFFYAVLARLYRAGRLERTPQAGPIVEAIRAVLAADDSPRHVTFATGLEVVLVGQRLHGAAITMDGLSIDDANAIDGTLADSSPGRERLRRFRGTFALGGLDAPPESGPLADGVRLTPLAPGDAVLIDRTFEPTLM